MKRNNYIIGLTIILVLIFSNACNDEFLEVDPNGALSEGVLANQAGVDNLLIGAYSMLDGVSDQGFGWQSTQSNWVFGSIRGGEANKGSDAGDQPDINALQNYTEASTNPYLDLKWRALYEGISRTNKVIFIANKALEEGAINQAAADLAILEARGLRGHYHFEAWKMWGSIVYVDVDDASEIAELTNDPEAGDKLIADLQAATALPNDMGLIGKFNGTVVKVILAKALMQIKGDYAGALTLLNDVVNNGTKPDGSAIGLAPTYGEIFDAENRNGIEAIYTIQYSVNDGSGGWNGGWGEVLNFPHTGGPGACCGFFQPSFDFVNSFRTVGGLPLLDGSYNDPSNETRWDYGIPGGSQWVTEEEDEDGNMVPKEYEVGDVVYAYDPAEPYTDRVYRATQVTTGDNPLTTTGIWDLIYVEDHSLPVDPRLDWSAGRRGVPYWDWGPHPGQSWIRDQSYAGPFSPKKQVYKAEQQGQLTEVGNWTSGWTANGYRWMRYADVLLLRAECLIETNDLAGALNDINAVRNRAANPAGFVMEADGVTPAGNYEVVPYTSFSGQEEARQALRMERKLELGLEGHRFFDLRRWDIAEEEINRFLNYEKNVLTSLYNDDVSFGSEDAWYPIPQNQIDLSRGNLTQNR